MQNVYFISGLGADRRIFQYLRLKNIRPHYVSWITPKKNESWESYAGRLLVQINEPDPIIIGMSMGGMMAIEINKLIPVKKIILISSAKTCYEVPPYFRLLRIFKGHQWLSYKLLVRLGLILGPWLFGATCKADKQLLREIIYDTDETFFRWAWQKVASWKNTRTGQNIVQLHGTSDHMLPAYFVKADHTVQKGTHLMVVNRADEISAIVNRELSIVNCQS